jgi:hypothetical protein
MVSTFSWWPGVFIRLWFVRSQRPTTSGDARHSPVRCGSSLKGGAYGNGFLWGLGLQRIAAGFSARLITPGVVQRQKAARATSSVFLLVGGIWCEGDTTSWIWATVVSLRLDLGPGGWGTPSSTSTTISGTSPERGAVRRVGGPRAWERHAEWRVGDPRARESDVQQRERRCPRVLGVSGLSVSSLRRVIGRGAAALRRGVLHGNDPLGA